jgi:plasmid maintenance system antidote protein VapI
MSSSLLEITRRRIHNGDFSERSLARFLGISQSHAHNVLKGVRHMTPELFDTMLKRLGLDVLDLFPRAEILHHLARRKLP